MNQRRRPHAAAASRTLPVTVGPRCSTGCTASRFQLTEAPSQSNVRLLEQSSRVSEKEAEGRFYCRLNRPRWLAASDQMLSLDAHDP